MLADPTLAPTDRSAGDRRVTGRAVAPSDYAILKRRVAEAGLLEKQPGFALAVILGNVALLALVLGLFAAFRQPWMQVLTALLFAFVGGQMGFLFHDSGHRQMFAKGWKNVAVGLIFGNLLLGMSRGWWVKKHNAHHANPNHVDMDPDIENPAIAYSQEQALSRRGPGRFITAHQAALFFPLLTLQAWSMHGSSIRFLINERSAHRRLEILLLLCHAALYLGLGLYFLGPWSTLLVLLVQQGFGGIYMASVFAPNHKGMLLMDADTELDFLRSQVLTSRNIHAQPLTDFWYGGLNYQVEHHLFPAMPRNKLRQAHAIISDYCRELGIPMHETSMLQSYRELLGYLHEVSAPLRRAAVATTEG